MNQTSIVLDTNRPAVDRRNATMFLLHFFGDLHQPMHTSGFKLGGNGVRPVCWDTPAPCAESNRSLHGVWDAAIPRKLRGLPEDTSPEEDKAAAVAWAEDIYERLQAEGNEDVELQVAEVCAELDGPQCVLQWAAESNGLVCSHALSKGEKWVMENDLSRDYFHDNAKLVEEQVGKAGVRLAAWMNAIARVLVVSEHEEEWLRRDL